MGYKKSQSTNECLYATVAIGMLVGISSVVTGIISLTQVSSVREKLSSGVQCGPLTWNDETNSYESRILDPFPSSECGGTDPSEGDIIIFTNGTWKLETLDTSPNEVTISSLNGTSCDLLSFDGIGWSPTSLDNVFSCEQVPSEGNVWQYKNGTWELSSLEDEVPQSDAVCDTLIGDIGGTWISSPASDLLDCVGGSLPDPGNILKVNSLGAWEITEPSVPNVPTSSCDILLEDGGGGWSSGSFEDLFTCRAPSPVPGDILFFNGSTWAPSSVLETFSPSPSCFAIQSDGTSWSASDLSTFLSCGSSPGEGDILQWQGGFFSIVPLEIQTLGNSGANLGEVIQWNGTSWTPGDIGLVPPSTIPGAIVFADVPDYTSDVGARIFPNVGGGITLRINDDPIEDVGRFTSLPRVMISEYQPNINGSRSVVEFTDSLHVLEWNGGTNRGGTLTLAHANGYPSLPDDTLQGEVIGTLRFSPLVSGTWRDEVAEIRAVLGDTSLSSPQTALEFLVTTDAGLGTLETLFEINGEEDVLYSYTRLDMQDNRVEKVDDPLLPKDAVNLQTLNDRFPVPLNEISGSGVDMGDLMIFNGAQWTNTNLTSIFTIPEPAENGTLPASEPRAMLAGNELGTFWEVINDIQVWDRKRLNINNPSDQLSDATTKLNMIAGENLLKFNEDGIIMTSINRSDHELCMRMAGAPDVDWDLLDMEYIGDGTTPVGTVGFEAYTGAGFGPHMRSQIQVIAETSGGENAINGTHDMIMDFYVSRDIEDMFKIFSLSGKENRIEAHRHFNLLGNLLREVADPVFPDDGIPYSITGLPGASSYQIPRASLTSAPRTFIMDNQFLAQPSGIIGELSIYVSNPGFSSGEDDALSIPLLSGTSGPGGQISISGLVDDQSLFESHSRGISIVLAKNSAIDSGPSIDLYRTSGSISSPLKNGFTGSIVEVSSINSFYNTDEPTLDGKHLMSRIRTVASDSGLEGFVEHSIARSDGTLETIMRIISAPISFLDLLGHPVKNVLDPVDSQDAVTLSFLEDSIESLNITLSNELSSIQGDLSTLENDVDTLETQSQSNTLDISFLQGNVSNLQTDTLNLESQVQSNEVDINFLQGNVSDLQSNTVSSIFTPSPGPLQISGDIELVGSGGLAISQVGGTFTLDSQTSIVSAGVGLDITSSVLGSETTYTVSLDANVGDLQDVDTSGASIGDLLRWDGSDWVPTTPIITSVTRGYIYSQGDVAAGGGANFISGATVASGGVGRYTVTFTSALPNDDYPVSLTLTEDAVGRDDIIIQVVTKIPTLFTVQIHEGDNGGAAGGYINAPWSFQVSQEASFVTAVSFS